MQQLPDQAKLEREVEVGSEDLHTLTVQTLSQKARCGNQVRALWGSLGFGSGSSSLLQRLCGVW